MQPISSKITTEQATLRCSFYLFKPVLTDGFLFCWMDYICFEHYFLYFWNWLRFGQQKPLEGSHQKKKPGKSASFLLPEILDLPVTFPALASRISCFSTKV